MRKSMHLDSFTLQNLYALSNFLLTHPNAGDLAAPAVSRDPRGHCQSSDLPREAEAARARGPRLRLLAEYRGPGPGLPGPAARSPRARHQRDGVRAAAAAGAELPQLHLAVSERDAGERGHEPPPGAAAHPAAALGGPGAQLGHLPAVEALTLALHCPGRDSSPWHRGLVKFSFLLLRDLHSKSHDEKLKAAYSQCVLILHQCILFRPCVVPGLYPGVLEPAALLDPGPGSNKNKCLLWGRRSLRPVRHRHHQRLHRRSKRQKPRGGRYHLRECLHQPHPRESDKGGAAVKLKVTLTSRLLLLQLLLL